MEEIPESVSEAAKAALLRGMTKAHMTGEETDPIECISIAILAERERCAKVAEDTDFEASDNPFIGSAIAAAIRSGARP